jgi:hypothetical protein
MFSLLIYSHLKYRIYYGVWGVRDRRVYETGITLTKLTCEAEHPAT